MSIWVSIRGSIHLLMVKKTKGQELSEELLMDRKSIPETEHGLSKEADEFCEGYKAFLTNKTEREANLFAAEILLTDKETLSVMSYASAMEEAAFELGVVPQILSYKLELLNHKGHHFNITDTASDFLK